MTSTLARGAAVLLVALATAFGVDNANARVCQQVDPHRLTSWESGTYEWRVKDPVTEAEWTFDSAEGAFAFVHVLQFYEARGLCASSHPTNWLTTADGKPGRGDGPTREPTAQSRGPEGRMV